MKLSEILQEENSDSRQINRIKLYKENGGWYRAYELSAYLLEFYPNNLNENQRLHPTKRENREIEDGVISVGLKLESLTKYAPNSNPEMEGEDVVLTVDINSYFLEEGSDVKDVIKKWKESIPLKESDKKDTSKGSKFLSNPVTFSSIFKKILSYNLKQRSNDDNAAFIEELKEMAIQMI